jgi:hypothetical protein
MATKNGDRILQRYAADIKRHPGAPKNFTTPLEIIQYISSNTNPKLIIWTATQYLKGTFSLEDVGIIKQDFDLFNKLKPVLQKKDIGQYSSVTELRDTLEQNKSQLGKKQSTLNKETSIQNWVDSGEAEMVYNKNGFLIVLTKTHAANCAIGSGTKWCTTTKDPSVFRHYANTDPIYIIFTPDNQKYQLHNETKQFMDAQDRPALSVFAGQICPLIKHRELLSILQHFTNSTWITEDLINRIKQYIPMCNRVKQGQETEDDLRIMGHELSKMYDENADSWNDDLDTYIKEELDIISPPDIDKLILHISISAIKNDIYVGLWALVLTEFYEPEQYDEVAEEVADNSD